MSEGRILGHAGFIERGQKRVRYDLKPKKPNLAIGDLEKFERVVSSLEGVNELGKKVIVWAARFTHNLTQPVEISLAPEYEAIAQEFRSYILDGKLAPLSRFLGSIRSPMRLWSSENPRTLTSSTLPNEPIFFLRISPKRTGDENLESHRVDMLTFQSIKSIRCR
jgi:hypothetical protein